MHYYQHHIGDFIRDTSRLKDNQCMAYLRLIWMYYDTEMPLDNNPQRLAFQIGADQNDVSLILEFFFHLDGDVWRHRRCEAEIQEYKNKQGKARKSANARWENANKKRTQCERNANACEIDANQEPRTKNQEPRTKNQKPLEPLEPLDSKPSVLPSSDSNESSLVSSVAVGPAQKNNLVVLGKEKKDASATLTGDTWEAYSNAYHDRYGAAPVRNATVNGQLSQFVKRIGKEESPLVAMFFVWHNAAFYVKKMHPVGLMLSDAEKLRTEWATNRSMTDTQARQADQTQARGNLYHQLVEEFQREGKM